MVESHLEGAGEPSEVLPKAVIAPHAGFVFSGPIAGHAFRAFEPGAEAVERVVVIGPSHFVPFEGLASSSHDAYRTPLGTVEVDRDSVEALVDAGLVAIRDEPHRLEHSLETHLPYLQQAFGEFELVPIVTGRGARTEQTVVEVLEECWEGSETVVSVSSDLSHYLSYEEARRVDDRTRAAIEALEPGAIEDRQACGHTAVRGLLAVAEKRGLQVETLAMCNSGDTAGDKGEVVGYGAWRFAE